MYFDYQNFSAMGIITAINTMGGSGLQPMVHTPLIYTVSRFTKLCPMYQSCTLYHFVWRFLMRRQRHYHNLL